MANRIVITLRVAAAAAPIVLLVAAPFLIGGFYTFGQMVDQFRNQSLAAMGAARGMELALYQIEWSRTRPDGDQIMMDQRRQFVHWLDLAKDRAESDDQRKFVVIVAEHADPIFEELRRAGRAALGDDALQRRLRDLHGQINDLISADDAVIEDSGVRARQQALWLMAVSAATMILVPWLAFAAMAVLTGTLRKELRSIRDHLENLAPRLAPAGAAAETEAKAIDGALERLGFPKPNPMLAE